MITEVPNYIVSTLSFIGFILLMIPFPWHWKSVCSRSLPGACSLANLQMTASNRGTCFYIVWAALGCLSQFINSVIWNKNVINRAPVWCDICEFFRLFVNYQSDIDASSVPRSDSYHYRDIDCHPSCVIMYYAPPLPNNMSTINQFIKSRSGFDVLIYSYIPGMPDNACRRSVVQSLLT
jgi:Pheromone A receptor